MAQQRPDKTPKRPSPPGEPALTEDVFRAICKTLADIGVKYKACEAHGWKWDHVRTVLRQKPDWQALWDESLDMFRETLENEARERARDGWDEPIFYKGSTVGYVRRKSDRILELMLRAHFPERYRDNVHLTGNLSQAPTLDLSSLSQEGRDEVRKLLDGIRAVIARELGPDPAGAVPQIAGPG
jgi:hypothetical protein